MIDIQPKRPTSGVGPHDVMGTALAGLEKLLFLGDAEGKLLAWDTSTGKCSLLTTGGSSGLFVVCLACHSVLVAFFL